MSDLYPDKSLDELLREGRCECGVPLATHPPLPRVPELASWQASRLTPPELRAGSSLLGPKRLTDDELARRRQFAGKVAGQRRPWDYVP